MKSHLKFISSFLLVMTPFFKVHSQESLIIDTIISRGGTTYNYESVDWFTLVDTAKKEPITGWVKNGSKKVLSFRHYLNGKLDGYSVLYYKRKQTYRLEEIAKYRQGEIQTKALFSHKKQFHDSTGYSWGLTSFSVWNPDSLDKKLVFREIKDIRKNVVIDHSYSPESNRKYQFKYKISNNHYLMKDKVLNLGQELFPFELNENSDVFSFVRYSGYYYYNQNIKVHGIEGLTFFIKFLPNRTAVVIRKNEILNQLGDWSDSTSVTYQVNYGNKMNVPSNSFQIYDGDKVIMKGKISAPNRIFLELPNYEGGPFLRHFLEYVK